MKITPYVLAAACALAVPSTVAAQGEATATQKTRPAPLTKRQAQVKGYVLPIVVGVESAKLSASALYELCVTAPSERRSAAKLTKLAGETIKMARGRSLHLLAMKGLSPQAVSDARAAATKLTEARVTVERVRFRIGASHEAFPPNEARNVRDQSRRLYGQLVDARRAIDRVASRYQISIGQESLEPKSVSMLNK